MVENLIQINGKIMINISLRVKLKIKTWYEKDHILNTTTYSCEKGKYLASITNNSVITCDGILEQTKMIATNFNERKITCKTKNFTCFFINCHYIIDTLTIFFYLIKYKYKKTFITISRTK